MTEKTILAIDPGTHKCGMAIVRRVAERKTDLVWRRIVPTTELAVNVCEAIAENPFDLVIVGSGTHSRAVVQAVRTAMPSMAILVVDEKNTTFQARERYWEHHRRRGWRRLLPSTMLVPPDPVDDFAALVLAERVLLDS